MKNMFIELSSVLVIVSTLNVFGAVSDTNNAPNEDAIIAKLGAITKSAQDILDVTKSSTPESVFEKCVSNITNLSVFNNHDVTNAACMANVADLFLSNMASNMSVVVRSNLSGEITSRQRQSVIRAAQEARNSLVKANFGQRLAVAWVKIDRAENKPHRISVERLEIYSSLDFSEWKKNLEFQWNRNQIYSAQLVEMIKFMKDTDTIIVDLDSIAPPEQLSAAVSKFYSNNVSYFFWFKKP